MPDPTEPTHTVFALHFLDYVAFFAYFGALSLIGWWAGRKKDKTSADYFLAGRSLPWYVVGSSYIAANISTEHFIGLIGAAMVYGICAATGEWSTVIAFTFLIWLYIPYLLTTKVYTAPEFLEKRFNKPMRTIFATVTILVNVLAFLGPVTYGGALVLEELFNVQIVWSIIIIAISSGIWAIWGGLRSIALMDVLTILVMVFGG
jgi:SSS family solute:Na+ symporter